ncbi:MAG: sulfotransferase family protein, partial [Caulobacteraceae bacterium]
MALKVVGSGLGRTGTKSMQTALAMLGFGPCHHMVEVFKHPESMALWIRAAKGETLWDEIFKDYRSMVDYPGAAHWRAIADHYPDAKVLHTVRDPDAWFDSTQATIFAPQSNVDDPNSPNRAFFDSFSGPFRAHIHDRAFMTDYFRRHTEVVKAAIAPERLLIYEVREGWERLA